MKSSVLRRKFCACFFLVSSFNGLFIKLFSFKDIILALRVLQNLPKFLFIFNFFHLKQSKQYLNDVRTIGISKVMRLSHFST